jgi:hypothetical protein
MLSRQKGSEEMAVSDPVAYEDLGKWKRFSHPPYLDPYCLNPICPGDVEDVRLKYTKLKYWEFIVGEPATGVVFRGPFVGPVQVVNPYDPIDEASAKIAGVLHTDRENRIADLERQNQELCRFTAHHPPHKQFLKTALAFLVFFSAVLTIQLFSGIWLIAPALAWVGMALGASVVVLSYLAALDWRDWRSGRDSLQ